MKRITFTDTADVECIVLAQFGMSSRLIHDETGLTPAMISYRLHKVKEGELPKGVGFRTAWREGTSETARYVLRRMTPRVRSQRQRTLPIRFRPVKVGLKK